jgi:hypothetical protein
VAGVRVALQDEQRVLDGVGERAGKVQQLPARPPGRTTRGTAQLLRRR